VAQSEKERIAWALFQADAARTSLAGALAELSAAHRWTVVEFLSLGLAAPLRVRAVSNGVSHLEQANRCLIELQRDYPAARPLAQTSLLADDLMRRAMAADDLLELLAFRRRLLASTRRVAGTLAELDQLLSTLRDQQRAARTFTAQT
jgi:hypothetical protein